MNASCLLAHLSRVSCPEFGPTRLILKEIDIAMGYTERSRKNLILAPNSFKQRPSWEANCPSSGQKYRPLMKPDGYLPRLQERAIGPYPEPAESTSQACKLFPKNAF
jgi:hypothetical protein